MFGKTVPDVSLNAIANLGYANGRFGEPVYPGDTLSANIDGDWTQGRTRTVKRASSTCDRSESINAARSVVDFVRWVIVRKRNVDAPAPDAHLPDLPEAVDAQQLASPFRLSQTTYDIVRSGSPDLWDDYEVGERIDHVDGMTIEEADHMLATRLYQNTARVHFNQHVEGTVASGAALFTADT